MTRENFKILASGGILLDGATGTELIKQGMPAGVSPELWVYEHPEAIEAVHEAYFNSGSDIVYAPTFGGNRRKMAEFRCFCPFALCKALALRHRKQTKIPRNLLALRSQISKRADFC